jgi:asparagine synthase (glutamine-hydrolysing)
MANDFLQVGRPRFVDSQLAELACREGAKAAWMKIFSGGQSDLGNVVHGDFAVGMRLPNGDVFLAIDRFAVHSLCYRIVDGGLHFAERADDLADEHSIIDPQAIFDYFYSHCIPSPRTIFKGIYRLPPGCVAYFSAGALTVLPYWTPVFVESSNISLKVWRDEFRHLLHQAVSRQLDGSKAACFLSGGTDSSTVAGIIGEVTGKPAATYSIGFEAEGYDEMEFARIAARRFGTEHHEYYVTPEDLVCAIPSVARYYDQPFGNSSALPAYYCAKMAREDGVSRILGGDGGDELFGGNTRYAKQKVFGWYAHIPRPLRTGVLEPLLGNQRIGRLSGISKVVSYVDQAKVPMPDRLQMYNLIMRLGMDAVFSGDFLRQVDTGLPLVQQREVWQFAKPPCSEVNRQLAFDWRYTLAESDLPKIVGTASLAGLSVGFPLLDDDLLAFSQRLPSSLKLNGLQLRWFFKEALKGFLPDEIIAKKKQGFGLPFGVWVTRNSNLRELSESSLRSLVDRDILRGEFVDALFRSYLGEHPGYYGEMIWISMMFAQWMYGLDERRATKMDMI